MKPYEFLKTLLNTPSPSGFETRGQKVWIDYVSPVSYTHLTLPTNREV